MSCSTVVLQSFDERRPLGAFVAMEASDALKSRVRLKLGAPVWATVRVMDVFGKPLKDVQVQMKVSTRPDEAWWTVGKTDCEGILKADRLYRDAPYSFRALLKGYRTAHTSSLPRVGSKGWMNRIEILMEKAEEDND